MKASTLIKNFIKKILLLVLFLFVLSVVVFLLARLSPGDPLKAYFGDALERMNEAQRIAATQNLGLDKSIASQYVTWLGDLFHGDWGISYKYKMPVIDIISRHWLNTVLLSGTSYVLTFIFSILLGVWCAVRQGTIADQIIRKIGTVTSVVPEFFVSLIFILIFAVNLSWLPIGSAYSLGGGGIADRIIHLILPVTVMIICHLWYYAYMVRNKMIEEMATDYAALLKMKGVGRSAVIWKHCFKNILPSVISLMVIVLPHFIGGTYIVEMVFAYPGLGSLGFESALYHDYNMLMAICLITGTVIIVCNLIGEKISRHIDPRIKSSSSWNLPGRGEGAYYA